MTGCDTSFLLALYLIDNHTAKARARIQQIKHPSDRLALSPFHQYELVNAVGLSVFRGLRSVVAAEAILAAFETDLHEGRFALPTCNLAVVLSEAQSLSMAHTARVGHRAFDILHVAAALHFGTKDFLTFDSKQGKLARAVGLNPEP